MKIFPAIDIKDKKCVRLIKGNFESKTVYSTSPVDQAGKYKDHGFKNLHIVDLDGALTGKTVNLDIIKEIVSKYDLKIEIGGGIRNIDSIKQYIEAGVENEIYNVAGGFEQKNIDTVTKILEAYFDEKKDWSLYLDLSYCREGQDVRYALNDEKLRALGWSPSKRFDKELIQIVEHYKKNFKW